MVDDAFDKGLFERRMRAAAFVALALKAWDLYAPIGVARSICQYHVKLVRRFVPFEFVFPRDESFQRVAALKFLG